MAKIAFITGVSSGIGYEIARNLLDKDYIVYGVSRRTPRDLLYYKNFNYCCADVSNIEDLTNKISCFLLREHDIQKIDYLFLNAGEFNRRIASISDIPVAEFDYQMNVNVWHCKVLLDVLLRSNIVLDTVIVSSSIAGTRARQGMSGYSITKAALNMMIRLYAMEFPEIFFAVLGLCNVDTYLSKSILALPLLGDFPELAALQERASQHDYLVTATERAQQMVTLLETDIKRHCDSGEFIDIREILEEK